MTDCRKHFRPRKLRAASSALGRIFAWGLLATAAHAQQPFNPINSAGSGTAPLELHAPNSLIAPPRQGSMVAEGVAAPAVDPRAIPADFMPWWQQSVAGQLIPTSAPLALELDNVLLGTLMHSPRVRVFTDAPMIRQTAVVEAQSKFDPRSFMESRFTDTSDPVGNTLTTGGANRFIDQNAFGAAGVRKLGSAGTQVEVSQRFGYETNNSIYFVPNQQGTAKLAIGLTQPLLNGAGKAYNNSLIVVAEIDSGIAKDQFCKDIQATLLEVHQTYWDLYLQRAALLQKRKLYYNAVAILDELNARRDVDVLGSQLVRARASVAAREAGTIRFETSVGNVESKMRALVNDPALQANMALELIPVQRPNQFYADVPLYDSLVQALQNRPEVSLAGKEVKAAVVRSSVSKNELLPQLNFIMATYVSGLQGGGAFMTAFSNQFDIGRPTYSTGLTFDMPLGNRGAKARMSRRQLEIRQLTNQLQSAMADIRAEVEIAVREVRTTYREMQSKYHAMLAAQAEIGYLTERWRLLPGDQQVAGVVLDSILNAQERLSDAEYGFAGSMVAYNVSLVRLKWATGTLMSYGDVQQLMAAQQAETAPILSPSAPSLPATTLPANPAQELPPPTMPGPVRP